MQISVVKIGNSKGIRLAKNILEKYDIQDKVEVVFKEGFFIIKPIKKVREGWETSFKEMAKNGDDELLINDVFEDENFAAWD